MILLLIHDAIYENVIKCMNKSQTMRFVPNIYFRYTSVNRKIIILHQFRTLLPLVVIIFVGAHTLQYRLSVGRINRWSVDSHLKSLVMGICWQKRGVPGGLVSYDTQL